MKASLDSVAPKPVKTQETTPVFTLGRRYGNEDVYVDLTIQDALNHIHAFGPSSASRTDMLINISRNAIENNSGLVFCQAVANEADRNAAMLSIMNRAVNIRRRRDFFVLDISDLKSKLGNTFNILEHVASGDQAANLFLELTVPNQAYFPVWVSRALIAAAGERHLSSHPDQPLTVDGLCRKLDEIKEETEFPLEDMAWRPALDGKSQKRGFEFLAEYVRTVASTHPRIFDTTSKWSGIRHMFDSRQIVVVFLADGDGIAGWISKIVLDAVKRAICEAPITPDYPNMVVFNDLADVGLSDRETAAAASRRIVLAVGDQCPTLPAAFSEKAARFRCLLRDRNEFDHCLATDEGNGEIGLYSAWRRA
ncbi:hypothetical protein HFO56_23620 [Rhizobium laguerreae]|nr:hypothetical protein [Rhizobium laguerreae]